MRTILRTGGQLLALALFAGAAWAQSRTEPLPQRELMLLATTYEMLKKEYADELSGEALVLAAVRGMLRLTDPEGGDLYTEEELAELQGPSGPVYAVGLEMTRRGEDLLVVSPIVGSAGDAAGLRPGDVIVKIDQRRAAELSLREAVKLLRGPEGSKVMLTARRGSGPLLEFEVERRLVTLPGAAVDRPAPGIAVLRISSFSDNTLRDTAGLLRKTWGTAPPRGIVLDLRRNSGGLLDTAIGIASIFLPAGATVAQMNGRLPESKFVWKTGKDFYTRSGPDLLAGLPSELKQLPLVVLVDEGTAAGAEMVAAALKDHQRAMLVGRRTFGRASIQTVRRVESVAVKFTTSRWVTPIGQTVHRQGVQPDREVVDGELELALALLKARF